MSDVLLMNGDCLSNHTLCMASRYVELKAKAESPIAYDMGDSGLNKKQ